MSEFTLFSKEFFRALESGELIGSKCLDCGEVSIPQREICPVCHSNKIEVETFSGKGKLVAYTVISVPPVKMAEAGYDSKNPYCVGIVELEEGPRISAQILDVDLAHPELIEIGTELQMDTILREEGGVQKTYLAFKPA
ncbi:MAG: Zn-ribbon domain-containing OB-fold protein [Anaerolineaceae bacterium]|nr:Zn-ribbon domain-containing OB-fold protein [Anaerolineaceae bacterium]